MQARCAVTKIKTKDNCLEAHYRHIERLPSKRTHVESVINWMKGNKPLVAEESGFLNTWDDLISPRERADHGGLDIFISRCVAKLAERGFRKVRALTAGDELRLICCRYAILTSQMINTSSW